MTNLLHVPPTRLTGRARCPQLVVTALRPVLSRGHLCPYVHVCVPISPFYEDASHRGQGHRSPDTLILTDDSREGLVSKAGQTPGPVLPTPPVLLSGGLDATWPEEEGGPGAGATQSRPSHTAEQGRGAGPRGTPAAAVGRTQSRCFRAALQARRGAAWPAFRGRPCDVGGAGPPGLPLPTPGLSAVD